MTALVASRLAIACRAGLVSACLACATMGLTTGQALAQAVAPPAVGVVAATPDSMNESMEFSGRLQAQSRVELLARVTGFLEEQAFQEGADVKAGDLLYSIEAGPYQATVDSQSAVLQQAKAQQVNTGLTLQRAQTLLARNAGTQSDVDNALAADNSAKAQITLAEAQLRAAQINLDYTRIQAPIDGRIGRTSVTKGNVVGPNSGVLATIISQDPIYVTFPVPSRQILELGEDQRSKGGKGLNVRLRLADGSLYDQVGKLDFIDTTVAQDTDTILLRGVIANPPLPDAGDAVGTVRKLTDGSFVTVVLESIEPTKYLAVPRSAILSDRQGDYVFVVGADNKAEQKRVKLGQSTPLVAAVVEGLNEGDNVIVEGIQNVRPGAPVSPAPASQPAAAAAQQ
ncbi:efflux RND transporter periplasmic adaptor subunit [Pseudochelatococcus contaminans]|uniref:Membrane fusion protein (Multidrug efflux system) n=1 Tax=Pseudochelatococcus contaminans TaxID=1538103 RepID=A0A7W6EG79_9HYPH|nr:efflux RND transporter periplasmic adaptor subunit [Pseudochelatococcus contaminans]MBB3809268.1 membrane fusion protein (multidrug efflux system) [Pseudochelatococcus contaminans]